MADNASNASYGKLAQLCANFGKQRILEGLLQELQTVNLTKPVPNLEQIKPSLTLLSHCISCMALDNSDSGVIENRAKQLFASRLQHYPNEHRSTGTILAGASEIIASAFADVAKTADYEHISSHYADAERDIAEIADLATILQQKAERLAMLKAKRLSQGIQKQ